VVILDADTLPHVKSAETPLQAFEDILIHESTVAMARRRMITDRERPAKRPVTNPASGAALPAKRVSLFLLFLQEIISGRSRLPRRNPGVPAGSPPTEQRDNGGTAAHPGASGPIVDINAKILGTTRDRK
jgi:hypothetical protein